MAFEREDLETLRLLRAFIRITDSNKRREIIQLVERQAAERKSDDDEGKPKPSR